MKCFVPGQNVKIVARAVNSLSKIGDEIFIECSNEGIVLRTVNIAQSAFAEFRMNRSFFSAYLIDDGDNSETGVKVTMKSFLSVFKNPHCMDKQVESCEIKYKSTGAVVVFLIKYANSHVRKYYLPILENEKLEANVPSDAPNRLSASSKFLSSAVKNFRHSEDEVTFTVEKGKTVIKNHLEIQKGDNFLRTELCFHPTEFDDYSITSPTSVTFCFKELRAVLAFAEPSGLSVSTFFSTPGHPICFKVDNQPAYEANYVISTLNSTNANVDSSLVGSQKVGTGSLSQRRSNFGQEGAQQNRRNDIEQVPNSSVVGDLSNNSAIQVAELETSSATMLPPKTFADIEMRDIPQSLLSGDFPNRIDETATPNSSIHSSYGSNSEIFNNLSPASITPTSSLISPAKPQELDEEAEQLIKIVFARCLSRNQNVLNNIAEHRIVLANDSDPEQL